MRTNNLDENYNNLLINILHKGVNKVDRTGTGTISVFGREIRHNMSEGFPLLTTKKMSWESIVIELLWFLRGDTNIKYLVENGCNIWNGDAYKYYLNRVSNPLTMKEFISEIITNDNFAKEWGDLGPIYGKQWRNCDDIDQIADVIEKLKTDPDNRRMIVDAWNVSDLSKMKLPPCHFGFQLYTTELTYRERYDYWFNRNYETGMEYYCDEEKNPVNFENSYYDPTPKRKVSLKWHQRSVDTFLGLPFNIASYGLLLQILAKEVNMIPDELIGTLGDTHLYSNHVEQAKLQISRKGLELPLVQIKDFKSIDNLTLDNFKLFYYKSHPKIKAPLSN